MTSPASIRFVLLALPLVATLTYPSVACAEQTEGVPSSSAARLSLHDAVAQALAHNTSQRSALEDVRRAEGIVHEVRAASLPTLTANGIYTRLDSDRLQGTNVILPANQLAANATLAVPLIAAKQWAQWSREQDNVAATRGTAEEVRQKVIAAVARAYLTILSQRRIVEINDRAAETARAHFEFAHARFAGGIGNRIDEVRAQQEYMADLAQVQAVRMGLTRAREALTVLLGSPSPVEIQDTPRLADPLPLAQASEAAKTDRQDVRAAQLRRVAADHAVRDHWLDFFPVLSGQVQAFYQEPSTLTLPHAGWQAQLVLSVPLYDGGLRYGQQEEWRARQAEARVQEEGLLAQVSSEVRTAYESVQRADEGLRAAAQASDLAAEGLDLALTAYRAGATTNLEVIDAERRARDTATVAVQAEDASRQARLELLVASGRLPYSPTPDSRATAK